jgi:hypothetical protein
MLGKRVPKKCVLIMKDIYFFDNRCNSFVQHLSKK